MNYTAALLVFFLYCVPVYFILWSTHQKNKRADAEYERKMQEIMKCK